MATNEDARDRSLWRLNSVYSQGIGPCIVPFSLADLAASFPASRVFRLCRRWVLRVSSNPHPSALQVAKSPGFPESSTVLYRLSMQFSGLPESCIFRLYRRWFIEFPRLPHPSAPLPSNLQVSPFPRLWLRLAMSLRVSPNPHLPGAGDGSSSFLESHPSAPPSSNIRVSPALRLKQRLSIDSPGLPGSSIFRLRRRWFFEFPRVPHPSAALAA
jgi:hypothetical protein